MTDLAAADHKNQLVANLPGEHEGAAALDLGELGHIDECRCVDWVGGERECIYGR